MTHKARVSITIDIHYEDYNNDINNTICNIEMSDVMDIVSRAVLGGTESIKVESIHKVKSNNEEAV